MLLHKVTVFYFCFIALAPFIPSVSASSLEHWNDGKTLDLITSFVEDITREDSKNFVPVRERIAVFDNDGTLWTEKPTYNEVFFILSQIKTMAKHHPEWQTEEPFASFIKEGPSALRKVGLKGAFAALAGVYHIMTFDEIDAASQQFLSALHPTRKVKYRDTIYLPMVELISYLKKHEFEVYIVSGGTLRFMRNFAPTAYGIPRQNIIGSRLAIAVQKDREGDLELSYEKVFVDINDKEKKVVNIQQIIGKRPIIAVGNSDGDVAMLQYTTQAEGEQLGLLVSHDDEIREVSYTKGVAEGHAIAKENEEWHLISIKEDFRTVFSDVVQ